MPGITLSVAHVSLLLAAFVGLLVIAIRLVFSSLRYRLSPRYLEVRLLQVTVRRIRLDDIRYVSTRQTKPAEKWINTLRTSHRELVIHRRTGLLKNFIITPRRRYVFKARLDRAIEDYNAGRAGSLQVDD